MTLIELKNTNYQYDGSSKTVLHDNNISFDAGKLYVIMGKSGVGKSTLLSLLSGLDYPTSGDVLIEGVSIYNMDRNRNTDHVNLTKSCT